MGLDQDAMTHISEILMRFLYEVLEKKPINLTELQNHVKKILPSALTTFVVKQDAPDKVVSKKENGKSKEAKSSSEFFKKLNHIVKDQVRSENIDDRLVPVLHSIIEDILYDILKWAGIFVSKLPDVKNVITLPILKAAINADRMLSDLMEVIFSEEEPSTHMSIYQHQISDSSNKSISNKVTLNYEKIARNFRDAEDQYMRDLSINVNVFKRRLEIGIATDPAGKRILNGIFGNVHEIYELTIKIHRMIEDAIEMSDSPGMGMSFSELTEGCEFDSYITFMEIFREPLNKKVEQMLKEPRYTQFFDTEDRTYSAEQDGHAFRMAVKYVLPLLLHSVAAHFQCYVQFIKLLKAASDSKEDRSELNNSEQYFNLVQTKIHALGLPSNTQIEKYSRLQQEKQEPQFSIISRIAQSIEGYPSDQKAIGAVCNEFIREGDLYKFNHSSTTIKDNLRRSRKAERHAFLFDPLLILCKAHKAYKGVSYKYKNHFNIRKSDVFDLDDEEEIKNAFKIRQRVAGKDPVVFILFCNTPEEKLDWMTSIVEMQTSSILHRMLEAYNKEEENRIPSPDQYLSPEQYRFAEANTDENIVFEDYTHNSGIPVVRSATLIKLIERLTYHSYTDTDYVKTFMTTYRSFCPPSDLLSLLIERFNIPIPAPFAPFAHFEQLQSPPFHTRSGGPLAGRFDTVQSHGLHTYNLNQEQGYYLFRTKYQRPVQLKVLGILNQWVTHHFYDFTTDPELLRKLTNFLNGNHGAIRFTNNQKKWCNKILETIKRKQRSTDPTEPEPSIPEPNPSNFDSSTLRRNEKGKLIEVQAFPEIVWHFAKPSEIEDYDLLTLHPLEIGRQVTLLHFCLYRAIKPTELVGAVFNKSDKHVRSPQLIKFIEHINHLTFWVARSIVETESLDERIEMLSRVLEIMTVFEELNNFSGLMAFCSALGLQPVYRLNESKSRLDKEKHSWLERFEQVLKDSHHQGIIEKLHSVNPPCVPFFGIYLSKITFMEDGHTTFVKSARQQMNEEDSDSPMSNNRKLISFMKCRKIANVIREIQMYQNQPYLLRVEPSMRKFFETLDPMNGFKDRDDFETYLYNQSYKIEPKAPNRLEIVPHLPWLFFALGVFLS
uniref:Son of sevenless n=1 Tax=Acrobeloides nanus TaxID=290746 RepID=A0A914C1M6_9BILA